MPLLTTDPEVIAERQLDEIKTLERELLATRENVGLALDLLEQAIFPQDRERAIELLRVIAAEL